MQFKPLVALALATSLAQAAAAPYHLYKRYENATVPSSSSDVASSSAEGSYGYSASILSTDQSAGESSSPAPTSSDEDEWITSTIIQYITVSDASTTQTSAANTLTTTYPKSSAAVASSSSDDDEWITSTILEYVTLTSDSSTYTSATNTAVTTVANTNKNKEVNNENAGSSSDTTTSTITSLVTVTDGNGSTQLSTQLSATTEAVAAQDETTAEAATETGDSKQTVAAESAVASEIVIKKHVLLLLLLLLSLLLQPLLKQQQQQQVLPPHRAKMILPLLFQLRFTSLHTQFKLNSPTVTLPPPSLHLLMLLKPNYTPSLLH